MKPGVPGFCLCVALGAAAARAAGVSVIPLPAAVEQRAGACTLDGASAVAADADFAPAAELVAGALRQASGLPLPLAAGGKIRFVAAAAPLGDEGYELEVTPDAMTIRASAPAGAFYGGQTLLQLLDGKAVPCVTIKDRPRFAWRGLMLDCSRTFQSLEYLRRTIDRLAAYKLNVLHLHLTDDQGWRLEIKKYPELTGKGARFADKWNEPAAHQGFYTQAQMAELIRYAAARHVMIVPEIEMPGHSLAALACYPELSCKGGPFEIFPFFKGPGITDNVFCAGNDAAFEFFGNVLAEVAALFPSPFIHVGGDEVPKTAWKACPKCQARMKAEGLKNEAELQSYFIRRAEKLVEKHGKRLIGWDEILEGGLAPNAAVMSWRGMGGGTQAVKAGHDVVMSPTSHCYFDYPYTSIDTHRAFDFEPVPAGLTPEQAARVLGLQANFWSHIDREPEKVDRQLFPRLLGIAERGWSPQADRDWDGFKSRAKAHLPRLEALGVRCDTTPLEPPPQLGTWQPAQMRETYAPLTWDAAPHIAAAGTYRVTLRYTRGAHRLGIEKVELLADGAVVASDAHRGVTGASHENNTYRLVLKEFRPSARYSVRASAQSEGGTDSSGIVSIDQE